MNKNIRESIEFFSLLSWVFDSSLMVPQLNKKEIH